MLSLLTISACVVSVTIALTITRDGYYDTKYNHLDIERVLNNKRLVMYYGQCLLGEGPCTPQGTEFKRILPEAMQTNCVRCTEKQKVTAYLAIRRLKKEYPIIWQKMQANWDPNGELVSRFINDVETKSTLDGIVKIGNTNTQQVTEPPQQVAVSPQVSRPTQQVSRPTQQVSRPTQQVAGPPQQVAGPPQQVSGPTQQVAGSPQQVAGPPQQVSGPTQQVASPTQQVASPTQQVASPTQQVAGSPQQAVVNNEIPQNIFNRFGEETTDNEINTGSSVATYPNQNQITQNKAPVLSALPLQNAQVIPNIQSVTSYNNPNQIASSAAAAQVIRDTSSVTTTTTAAERAPTTILNYRTSYRPNRIVLIPRPIDLGRLTVNVFAQVADVGTKVIRTGARIADMVLRPIFNNNNTNNRN